MSETVAKYIRVSTEDQEAESHRDEVAEYIERHYPESHVVEYTDILTGTTTVGREQFQDLQEAIEGGEIDRVVTTSVSRVARNLRDLEGFVSDCECHGTAVEFTREGLRFDPKAEDPYQKAMLQMLGIFAELEAKLIQQRTREAVRHRINNGMKWGRPPLGYNKKNGKITEADNYDKVCSLVQLVDSGQLSQSKAAHELNTSRTTIKRCIDEEDRRPLYGLTA